VVAVCIICEGGSEEDLLASEFMRLAIDGFTAVAVLADPPWMHTIGLLQSWHHPELVITGAPEERAGHVLAQLIERVRGGERFDASSPPAELCECSTVAFSSVHPAQWDQGRFDQWRRYYDRFGSEPAERVAVQVLWQDREGRFPPDPEFCPTHEGTCQPLLDGARRHDAHRGPNREERRRSKHGHGKRGPAR